MRKLQYISLLFFLIFSNSSISQNKHNVFNHLNNLDIAFYFESGTFDIFFGKNTYREMYFEYKPRKNKWILRKNIRKSSFGFGLGKKIKVLARFENPKGGKDFILLFNRYGNWKYSGPNKWYNQFRKKVLKNL
tara:strand:- start:341 stop:739 length:399 start_codon:yes stop_codon:yes gene_type:complete